MTSGNWTKDTSAFVRHGYSLEFPLHKQKTYLTSNENFFVCSAGGTQQIDVAAWRLTIDGEGVENPVTLRYDDLTALPQKTVPVLLECAGNHRGLFEMVLGHPLNKRPHMTEVLWERGAAGMAEWTGVPLHIVLEKAGVRRDAVHVCPIGADRGVEEEGWGIRCPMPLWKALNPDTLIALKMNGEPLPPDHGFPARTIVPGWVGTYSIKWLERIIVSMTHMWVNRNTGYYVLAGDKWPQGDYAPASGAPISEQTIKSSLALPWPAHLPPGRNRISGFARSPDAIIREVVWSADKGLTWFAAEIVSENRKYAWVRFAFDWEASPGEYTLMTRATDYAGRTQPDTVPFNHGGYLFNMVHPHPVIIEVS